LTVLFRDFIFTFYIGQRNAAVVFWCCRTQDGVQYINTEWILSFCVAFLTQIFIVTCAAWHNKCIANVCGRHNHVHFCS